MCVCAAMMAGCDSGGSDVRQSGDAGVVCAGESFHAEAVSRNRWGDEMLCLGDPLGKCPGTCCEVAGGADRRAWQAAERGQRPPRPWSSAARAREVRMQRVQEKEKIECVQPELSQFDTGLSSAPVSYTHLTLPTIYSV